MVVRSGMGRRFTAHVSVIGQSQEFVSSVLAAGGFMLIVIYLVPLASTRWTLVLLFCTSDLMIVSDRHTHTQTQTHTRTSSLNGLWANS